MTRLHTNFMAIALVLALSGTTARAGNGDGNGHAADGYAAMLGYLDNSRIGGNALQNVSGITAVNQAAGAQNLQANLRALAVGDTAQALIRARQLHRDNYATAPDHASVSIGDHALENGRGIASINQASGNGNAELNAVAATLSQRGIRETTDGALSAAVSASAGGQLPGNPRTTTAGGTRNVAVEPSAVRGFQGLLQLNQIAGSGNATSNALLLSATPPSR